MASNPYEVEHNINEPASQPHRRRPDMSSFTSLHHQITRDEPTTAPPSLSSPFSFSSSSSPPPGGGRAVGPTPVDVAALYGLVQDQMATLELSAPDAANRDLLRSLAEALARGVADPPARVPGVSQAYLDALDRVPRKRLQAEPDATCPICAERHLDDPHPLVVELPCHGTHRFDLECVGPWLLSMGTCPLCRKDLTEKRKIEVPDDDEEDQDDVDGLYG
ncbi:hypothetical protein GGR56DRAFT_673839 [Xylariaceae sp. FL0804]|nr:hypothetical protein GGR56DRAFT_673839 [Xylariaceae sp. FL0804]